MRGAVVLALAIGALAAAPLHQQRPMFRTGAESVMLDVAVRVRDARLGGLTAADFEVTDNGVVQQVEMADAAAMPIDLTVVLDISGSMRSLIGPMTAYAGEVLALMQAGDRARLISVGPDVRQEFGFSADAGLPHLDDTSASGSTSLIDGIAASLMRTRPPDRRHIVVAVTDGGDTSSTLPIAALEVIAARTDSTLFVLRPHHTGTGRFLSSSPQNTRRRWTASLAGLNLAAPEVAGVEFRLADVARTTGGEMKQMYAVSGGLPRQLAAVLEAYRANYVLHYSPSGVAREGWHAIEVRVPRHPGAEIRARRGYFAG